jgi:hypothetical protein
MAGRELESVFGQTEKVREECPLFRTLRSSAEIFSYQEF